MARHRIIKNIDIDEERIEYNDYGRSVEEDICFSPSSAQFIYKRDEPNSQVEHTVLECVPDAGAEYPDVPPGYEPLPKDRGYDVQRPERVVSSPASSSKPSTPQKQKIVQTGKKLTAGFDTTLVASGGVSESPRTPKATTDVPKGLNGRTDSPSAVVQNVSATSSQKPNSRPSKPVLNLVIIGHVDAGKSTLMGHLLFQLGVVDQKLIHKYKQESQKLGKGSFAYAWVLDEGSEERSRGVTMDVARTRFETEHFCVNLLDAPGHKDFIPNMITGASQADAAILVVNATRGEFETGFDSGGQTREHTWLVRSLGVSQMIIALNKLDTVNWSEERYNEIRENMKAFLKQTGFAKVPFVPCCGLGGENVTKKLPADHSLSSWYHGPTLFEAIDSLAAPSRPLNYPLRFCVSDVYKGMSSGFVISGKVETGSVRSGDKLVFMPSGQSAVVKGIQIEECKDTLEASAGEQCSLLVSGIDISNITCGCMVCHPDSVVPSTSHFEAKIIVFSTKIPVLQSAQVVVFCNSSQQSGYIFKLKSLVNKTTGEILKSYPRCLPKNTCGIVEIKTDKVICLETTNNCRQLSRVSLRALGQTVAAGIVTKIF